MEEHRITKAPDSMIYFPNFLSAEEEASILSKIPPNRWVTLSHRRLQAVPARLTANNTLLAAGPLPAWLAVPAVERIHALGVFADAPHAGVNHCLINEYLPGQGIMAHEDGAAYHPVVATVSLGGTVVLDVRAKDGGEAAAGCRIVQEPRSLLITTSPAYEGTLHGIRDVEVDEGLTAETVANWEQLGDRERLVAAGGRNERQTRISLTFRDVKKVSSIAGKIFGRSRG